MYYIEYLISFSLAFIITFSATPIAKKISIDIGAVDFPDGERRLHKKPIARLGGIAIISGFVITLLLNVIWGISGMNGMFFPNYGFIGFMVGILIIIAVGIFDDIKQLSAKYKLLFQVIAAIIVVASGIRVEVLTNPFSVEGYTVLNVYMSYIISVLWIVGITNAINLIDGLDGLAVGVSSIASLSLFFIALLNGDVASSFLTLILAGSALGFLPYNFNPAKIFMGDTGATFLGFTLSVISIFGTLKSYAAIAIAIPILVFGLPIFDVFMTVIRRSFKGKSIMQADREHLHHRLIDMGLSHRQSVVVMYIASAALGLCAIVLVDKGALSALLLVIAVSIFIVGGAKYMTDISLEEDEEETERDEKKTGKPVYGKYQK